MSQFSLQDFHEEYAAEAFRKFDTNRSGFISVDDFIKIMTTIRSHLLTRPVQSLLKDVTYIFSLCLDP